MIVTQSEKKQMLIKFIALYVFAIVLLGFLFWAILKPKALTNSQERKKIYSNIDVSQAQLIRIDSVLHGRLDKLMHLSVEKNLGFYDSSLAKADIASQISVAQQILQDAIDSVSFSVDSNISSTGRIKLNSLISSFQTVLAGHQSIISGSSIATHTSTAPGASTQATHNLQEELQKKNTQIFTLRNELKTRGSSRQNNETGLQGNLDKENRLLKASLQEQINKNQKLQQANVSLERTIDKLNNRIDALRKFAGSKTDN